MSQTETKCVIYKYDFPNGKCYVGQSWDFDTRRKSHPRDKHCQVFYNAIKKYGKPEYEIMATFDSAPSVNVYEMFWIAYHKAKGGCYNIRDGASTGRGRHSERTKAIMRVKMKDNKNFLGKTHTIESRRKMSLAHKSKPKSESAKRKMSENSAWRGKGPVCCGWNKGKPAHNRGVPMSEGQKQKISATKRRKTANSLTP